MNMKDQNIDFFFASAVHFCNAQNFCHGLCTRQAAPWKLSHCICVSNERNMYIEALNSKGVVESSWGRQIIMQSQGHRSSLAAAAAAKWSQPLPEIRSIRAGSGGPSARVCVRHSLRMVERRCFWQVRGKKVLAHWATGMQVFCNKSSEKQPVHGLRCLSPDRIWGWVEAGRLVPYEPNAKHV